MTKKLKITFFFAAVATLALTTAVVTFASTKQAPFDIDYGKHGIVKLPRYKSIAGQTAMQCAVTAKGDIVVLGQFGARQPGLPEAWLRGDRIATAVVRGTHLRRGWVTARVRKNEGVAASDITSGGRIFYISIGKANGSKTRTVVHVHQLLANGKPNRKFGRAGVASVAVEAKSAPLNYIVRKYNVVALSDGGVVVAVQLKDSLQLIRFKANGRRANWGSGGSALAPLTDEGAPPVPIKLVDPVAETKDGGLLVPATLPAGVPATGTIGLLKLTSAGLPDATFGADGYWSPPAAAPVTGATGLSSGLGPPVTRPLRVSVRANGQIVVLYAISQTLALIGATSKFHVVELNRDGAYNGTRSPELYEHFSGGDTGFPDATPLELRAGASGIAFGYAETRYFNWASTYGAVSKLSNTGLIQLVNREVKSGWTGVDSLAATTDGKYMYACGGHSLRAKKYSTQKDRRQVAIQRIKL